MPDYKIIVTTGQSEIATQLIAADVLEKHGAGFDADRGDFTVIAEGDHFEIEILDVADGDVNSLADDILSDHAGVLQIRGLKGESGQWFPHDFEEED